VWPFTAFSLFCYWSGGVEISMKSNDFILLSIFFQRELCSDFMNCEFFEMPLTINQHLK